MEMAAIVNHVGVITLGQVIDLIEPDARGQDRRTIETKLGRWTLEGIFRVLGTKVKIGSSRNRVYAFSEVVLMAIAQRLSVYGLHIGAIEDITVALRSRLEHTPGSNPIDAALEWIIRGESEASNGWTDYSFLIAFGRVGASDLWHPIAPKQVGTSIELDDLASHDLTITLNLRKVLACLRPLLTDDALTK